MIIGSVLVPGAKAPKIITKNMLDKMESGTVLVDVAVDQVDVLKLAEKQHIKNPFI